MRKLIGFFALSLLAISLVPALAQPSVQVVGGDEASLRTFIERMMGPGPYDTDGVTIYIEELPTDLPFELPIPEGASIIGTSERSTYADILLDTDLEPLAVRDFYREALSGENWRDVSLNMQGGGFQSGPVDAQFCYQDMEAQLNVFASKNASGSTDIRLYVQDEADPYLCATSGGEIRRPLINDPYRLIPPLSTPEGVTIRDTGSGGSGSRPTGPTSAFQAATLETELTPQEIAEAYNTQLEGHDWTLLSAGSDEAIAWSIWTVEDEEQTTWAGTLIIHANRSKKMSTAPIFRSAAYPPKNNPQL